MTYKALQEFDFSLDKIFAKESHLKTKRVPTKNKVKNQR